MTSTTEMAYRDDASEGWSGVFSLFDVDSNDIGEDVFLDELLEETQTQAHPSTTHEETDSSTSPSPSSSTAINRSLELPAAFDEIIHEKKFKRKGSFKKLSCADEIQTTCVDQANNITTTAVPSIKKTKQQIKDELEAATLRRNKDVIMKMPFNFINFLNAGDLVSLEELIQKHFAPDCELHTATMKEPMFGSDKVLGKYKMLLETLPDGALILKQVRFDHHRGILHTRFFSSGTKCFYFSQNITDFSTSLNIQLTGDEPDFELLMKAQALEKAGKSIEMLSEVNWVMFLDGNLEKVQKFHGSRCMLAVEEAKPIRF